MWNMRRYKYYMTILMKIPNTLYRYIIYIQLITARQPADPMGSIYNMDNVLKVHCKPASRYLVSAGTRSIKVPYLVIHIATTYNL